MLAGMMVGAEAAMFEKKFYLKKKRMDRQI